MSRRFTEQPPDEDCFEEFCLRLLRKALNCPTLQLYGKRGEKQHGIDIIDDAHAKPLRAAQCKHHDSKKTLPPAELESEVEKAAKSGFVLNDYYVLTTARKSTQSQNRVIKINKDKAHGQNFVTHLWTWAEIERELANLGEADRDFVFHGGTGRDATTLTKMTKQAVSEVLAENSLTASDKNLQGHLDRVERHLKNENAELARYELNLIDELQISTTSKLNWYLIKRLNAKYLMLTGEIENAAKFFLEAYDQQPNLEQARINRAVAYELIGKKERAFELATQLKDEGVRSEPVPALLLRTAPHPISDELHQWLEDFLDTSEELNLVYAMQFFDEKQYDEVLVAATRAKQINPKSSRAALMEAMVFHTRGVSKRGNARKLDLETAYEKYKLALGDETDRFPERARSEALRNLSSVQFLLGKDDPKKTFEEAIEKAQDKAHYIGCYLNFLCSQEDFDTAKVYLEKIPAGVNFDDQQFLHNMIEYNTNESADKAAIIQSMFDLSNLVSNHRRIECLVFAVQWSMQSELIDEAISRLESSKDSTDGLTFHTCLAWLQLEKNEKEKAKAAAFDAKAIITSDSDNQLVAVLGRLFMRLNAFDEALPLFEQCADKSKLSEETRSLLDCAMQTGKHDVALDVCESLRLAQGGNSSTLNLEFQLLGRYRPTKALEVLEFELQKDPNNKQLYARLCFVKTRLSGVVQDLEISRLPCWNEIAVADSHLVMFPLIAAGHRREAIKFAYAQLRANWHEELAHVRYLWLFLQFASESGLPLHFVTVQDDCVVQFSEADGTKKILIIDGHCAEPLTPDEVRPTSAIGQLLIGRRVGDDVVLDESAIQPRSIKIEAIQSKYVHRYQDVLNNMQIRFRGTTAIQMIMMEHEGEFDISPIVKSLEERRKYVDQVLEEFKRIPAAIAFLAKWLGLSFHETFESLTALPEIGIRCCLGRNAGLEESIKLLRINKKLVIDQSAIFTIHKLGIWETLSDYELIVGRTTVDELIMWARNLEESGLKSGGTTFLDENGQLRLVEFTPEQVTARESYAKELVRNVQANCKVMESKTLPSLPEAREYYEEFEALPILESLLLATENVGAVLLADDVYVHWAAATDHKLPSVWTQILLDELRLDKRLSHDEFSSCVAKLIGWNYTPTQWNADAAFAACKLAEWDVNRQPLKSILKQFANGQVSIRLRCQIAVELLLKMYLCQQVSAFLHTSIVHSILDAMDESRAVDHIREDASQRFLPYENAIADLFLHLDVWEGKHLGR